MVDSFKPDDDFKAGKEHEEEAPEAVNDANGAALSAHDLAAASAAGGGSYAIENEGLQAQQDFKTQQAAKAKPPLPSPTEVFKKVAPPQAAGALGELLGGIGGVLQEAADVVADAMPGADGATPDALQNEIVIEVDASAEETNNAQKTSENEGGDFRNDAISIIAARLTGIDKGPGGKAPQASLMAGITTATVTVAAVNTLKEAQKIMPVLEGSGVHRVMNEHKEKAVKLQTGQGLNSAHKDGSVPAVRKDLTNREVALKDARAEVQSFKDGLQQGGQQTPQPAAVTPIMAAFNSFSGAGSFVTHNQPVTPAVDNKPDYGAADVQPVSYADAPPPENVAPAMALQGQQRKPFFDLASLSYVDDTLPFAACHLDLDAVEEHLNKFSEDCQQARVALERFTDHAEESAGKIGKNHLLTQEQALAMVMAEDTGAVPEKPDGPQQQAPRPSASPMML